VQEQTENLEIKSIPEWLDQETLSSLLRKEFVRVSKKIPSYFKPFDWEPLFKKALDEVIEKFSNYFDNNPDPSRKNIFSNRERIIKTAVIRALSDFYDVIPQDNILGVFQDLKALELVLASSENKNVVLLIDSNPKLFQNLYKLLIDLKKFRYYDPEDEIIVSMDERTKNLAQEYPSLIAFNHLLMNYFKNRKKFQRNNLPVRFLDNSLVS